MKFKTKNSLHDSGRHLCPNCDIEDPKGFRLVLKCGTRSIYDDKGDFVSKALTILYVDAQCENCGTLQRTAETRLVERALTEARL